MDNKELFKIFPHYLNGEVFYKTSPVFHGNNILTFNNTIGCASCQYMNKHKAFLKTGNILSPQPY